MDSEKDKLFICNKAGTKKCPMDNIECIHSKPHKKYKPIHISCTDDGFCQGVNTYDLVKIKCVGINSKIGKKVLKRIKEKKNGD